jgi:hypothetical protein
MYVSNLKTIQDIYNAFYIGSCCASGQSLSAMKVMIYMIHTTVIQFHYIFKEITYPRKILGLGIAQSV